MAAAENLSLSPVASHSTPGVGGNPTESADGPAVGQGKWPALLFTALLAALLASFPARNTDLWKHLAAGRDLAQGQSVFGTTSPRSAEVPGNPSWLYDLVSYGLYAGLGGRALVLVKILLVVGLALMLLRLSRTDARWGLAAACTALALLTMSPRAFLLVQSATVSYLFLALALWFAREKAAAPRGPSATAPPAPARLPPLLPPWPLWLLFAVWVNVDSGFLLGLAVVGLVWLGRTLDEPPGTGLRLRILLRRACAFALLAAACLLNPSHVHAFRPALELLGWSGAPGATAGPLATRQPTSPFSTAYLASVVLSPGGLAYYPLLGLGLLSFVMNLPRWHWQRFLPWAALALVSVLQVRAVPLFAVLAGPVLAWNLQESLARRPRAVGETGTQPDNQRAHRPGPLVAAGPWLAGLAAVGLLVCAWPGWLQAPPYEPRRWDVEVSPSLEHGAATTRRWLQEGKLRAGGRGLYLSPAAAHAFAWFCPEAPGVLDGRLTNALFFSRVTPDDWAERLRARGIDHVIVYDPDQARLLAALRWLSAEPEEWPLLYREGSLAVFGWRDAAKGGHGSADRFRGRELNLNRLAFRPAADRRAPRKRPEPESEPRLWWDAFWRATPPRTLDGEGATFDWLYAEALRSAPHYERLRAWEASQAAAVVTAARGWQWPGGLFDADLRFVLFRPPLPTAGQKADTRFPLSGVALACQRWYAREQDDTPPALPYLAVRAARRALAVNPEDADAYLALGESYLRLLEDTRERLWARRASKLGELRLAQASAALNRAVALKPDLPQAHFRLVGLYKQLGYLDLMLKHLRAYQDLTGAAVGADGKADPLLDRLAKAVAEGESVYADKAPRLRVLDRAHLALEKGLGGKARDLLLESDVSAFGAPGLALELNLLLRTGRVREVRDWTRPSQASALGGAANYHWLRAQALAALGEYALAEEECEQMAEAVRGAEPAQLRDRMALRVGEEVLDELPLGLAWPHPTVRVMGRLLCYQQLAENATRLMEDASANVFRGLLALEEGRSDEAEVVFRLALALWKDEATGDSGGGLDFDARPIAQMYLRLLAE
jgi:tetratricopeptide (TPR) repeat protein